MSETGCFLGREVGTFETYGEKCPVEKCPVTANHSLCGVTRRCIRGVVGLTDSNDCMVDRTNAGLIDGAPCRVEGCVKTSSALDDGTPCMLRKEP